MKLYFYGGAGTVTGSKYLLEWKSTRLMIDCGLFQGLKELRLKNWEKPAWRPDEIDALVLTHAHIDHSGYIPRLVRNGFRGPVFCTAPTRDLCEVLLADSARLQEEDAAYANRKGFSKHRPALPLYTEHDAANAIRHFKTVPCAKAFDIGPFSIRLVPAGHILGAVHVMIQVGGRKILFSGDIGRSHDALMPDPRFSASPDWVVMESTYGDRQHEPTPPHGQLGNIIKATVQRRGTVLIPAFAVGRTQTLLYELFQLKKSGAIPDIPVYVNSPMATDVSHLYERHSEFSKLSAAAIKEVCASATFTRSVEDSKALNRQRKSSVIISASGMLTGGRVLHHLRSLGPDSRNTILLVGYQAPGTRGAALLAGAKTVKMHGQHVPIRAQVETIGALSAHADQTELLHWIGQCERPPDQVFLTHGDPDAAQALALLIKNRLGWSASIPHLNQMTELDTKNGD